MDKVIVAYKRGYRITETGVVLNPKGLEVIGTLKNGYRGFQMRVSKNSGVNIQFHRLQAFQKYGEVMFLEGIEVRHKDNNSENNFYNNILIGTPSQNQMDIPEAIRISRAIHAASFLVKHDHSAVKEYHLVNGNSYLKTMAEFGISSKGTLNYILNK